MTEFMRRAIELAEQAKASGEIPVGAVIEKDGKIIGEGFNRREQTKLATAHAEVLAIEDACRNLGDWRLKGCTMYVTLEPCPMCMGALIMSRLSRVVFGAYSDDGAAISKANLAENFDSEIRVIGGFMADECRELLKDMI